MRIEARNPVHARGLDKNFHLAVAVDYGAGSDFGGRRWETYFLEIDWEAYTKQVLAASASSFVFEKRESSEASLFGVRRVTPPR